MTDADYVLKPNLFAEGTYYLEIGAESAYLYFTPSHYLHVITPKPEIQLDFVFKAGVRYFITSGMAWRDTIKGPTAYAPHLAPTKRTIFDSLYAKYGKEGSYWFGMPCVQLSLAVL